MVRAITPRVIAISGHVQIHRDADGIDLWKDDYATGLDLFDPEYLPPRRHGRMFTPPESSVIGSAARAAADPSPRHADEPSCSSTRDHSGSPSNEGTA